MKILRTIILIIALLQLISCNEKILDWDLNNEPSNQIVIEAVLTNENRQHLIKITKPYLEQNQEPDPVSGAIVTILSGGGNISAIENPVGSGLYYTDSMTAVSNYQYTLRVEINKSTYTATAIQPPGEELDQLKYYKSIDDLYTIDFYDSTSTVVNYIEYSIDWQTTNSCVNPDSCFAYQVYYDLKTVDVNEQFKPDQEQVNFPAGATIIRRKYSVSEDYQDYLRGVLSETYWRGGIFDVIPANAPSNLSNGAIGFFAVSTVESDTTIVTELP